MATRSRTQEFLALRDSFKPVRYGTDDGTSLLADPEDRTVQQQPPPTWLDIVDEVNYDIQVIREKLAELDKLHAGHLTRSFEDDTSQEHTIEIMTQNITGMFRKALGKSKRIGRGAGLVGEEGTEDELVRRNVVSSLGSQLQELSRAFKTSQQSYLKKMKEREEKERDFLGFGGEAERGTAFFEDDKDDGFIDRGFNPQQLRLVEDTERLVAEREGELVKIARSINELAEIFSDLATLVVEQGSLLDQIDHNMGLVSQHLEKAGTELVAASSYQKKYRKKLCILLLFVLIVAMVITLMAKGKQEDA